MTSGLEVIEEKSLPEPPAHSPAVLRRYECRCGRPVFFNSVCLACRAPLGYEPNLARICSLDPVEDGIALENPVENWTLSGWLPTKVYKRCDNLETAAACNWLIDANDPHRLCQCCRLNRTIPDLSLAQNAADWNKIEIAKRQLVSALIALGLPVQSRVSEDTARGLAFDFLRSLPGGPRVMTGHYCGIITLNVEEADDETRERHRKNLNEPYRTLLGHLRHEAGHYYWDRLIGGTRRRTMRERCSAITTRVLGPTGGIGLSRPMRARLGGLGRDLGALSAHHRHLGHSAQFRRGCQCGR